MFTYFSYKDIEDFFKNAVSLKEEKYHISSVGDLLYVAEQFKKNNILISSDSLRKRFTDIQEKIKDGSINFIELDKQILTDNLFEEDENGIISLDAKASNSKISPRFSISLLCLKNSGCRCYWGNDVFDDMEYYYSQIENHG